MSSILDLWFSMTYDCQRVINAGVNLSLLSRVMSSRLSRGTYNGGLLSTEAGTIARVIADATITLAGYLGESKLLNVTLLPSLIICISSIVATCYTFNSLYWFINLVIKGVRCGRTFFIFVDLSRILAIFSLYQCFHYYYYKCKKPK